MLRHAQKKIPVCGSALTLEKRTKNLTSHPFLPAARIISRGYHLDGIDRPWVWGGGAPR